MDSQQNNIPDYDARLDALVRPRRRRAFTRLRILMGCVVGAALVLSLLKDFTREPPPQPPGTLRMRVLNTGGIGGYREEEPCLVDITAPFTKIGTLEGVDVLRYGAANAGVGFCPPGTLVQLNEDALAELRDYFARDQARRETRRVLTEKAKQR